MKKLFSICLVLVMFPLMAMSATVDYQVNFYWDNKDTSGVTEASYPVVAQVAINGIVLSNPTLTITEVGDENIIYVIKPIPLAKVNNASTVYKAKVKVTDNAGNSSEWSDEAVVTIIGNDTIQPSKPKIYRLIIAWFLKLFHVNIG